MGWNRMKPVFAFHPISAWRRIVCCCLFIFLFLSFSFYLEKNNTAAMLIEQICIFEPNGGREFAAGQNGRFIFSEFGNVASFIPPTWPKWQPFQCNFGAVLERVPVGRSSLGAITEQFQSNCRAISEQFRSNFGAKWTRNGIDCNSGAISEQFRSNYGAIEIEGKCGDR